MLAVPMLREGAPSASIVVHRARSRRRSPTQQIALLKTFADQAVIAIENVRLFTGAGGAQPRSDRDPGAADRHRRDPAGHLELAHRRPAGLRHHRARMPPALQCRQTRSSVTVRRRPSCTRRPTRPQRTGPCGGVSAAPIRGSVAGRRGPGRAGRSTSRDVRRSTTMLASPRTAETAAALPERYSACPCSARATRRPHHRPPWDDAAPVHPHPDRPPPDLRRPGRHRHRERAPLHGAGGP